VSKFLLLIVFIINCFASDSVKTLKQLHEAIAVFEQGVLIGDGRSAYNLGLIYENEVALDDGIFKKDVKKAKKYFELALNKRIDIAGYNLSTIYMQGGEYSKALFVLDKTLKKENMLYKNRLILSTMFANLIIVQFPNEKVLLKKAKKYLFPVLKEKLASIDYLYALISLNLQETEVANKYLSLACQNQSIPDYIREICYNSDFVQRSNINKENNETNTTNSPNTKNN
jgi:tetratricopeptide (TPR) repeat protein